MLKDEQTEQKKTILPLLFPSLRAEFKHIIKPRKRKQT